MNVPDGTLAIIGLGYVGLPLAVEFAKDRSVASFVIMPERIANLCVGCGYPRKTASCDDPGHRGIVPAGQINPPVPGMLGNAAEQCIA